PGALPRAALMALPRQEVVQAYLNADLFVFASNVEYSPLVLFESAAAGLPFLSVPVGNAAEIAEWTGCGIICPAAQDARGYTRVSAEILGAGISRLVDNQAHLRALGATGRQRFLESYTWEAITRRYEALFFEISRDSAEGR
ncbi:MAG: glycosyltransferase, partial [Rhodocyclaceae bacterium]|nr:glycosyltransferase [Rhodocyclaceae bacterium]